MKLSIKENEILTKEITKYNRDGMFRLMGLESYLELRSEHYIIKRKNKYHEFLNVLNYIKYNY